MFGTYRTLLALTVVFVHFSQIAELSGLYAVFGFFVLSGYLMTLIMSESYGYTRKGIAAFTVNRFLRIFPIYWFALLIAVGILLIIQGEIWKGNSNFYLPENARQWFQNIALLLKQSSEPQLIQPAWTLTIELFFYACIGLGLSCNRRITLIWLAGSALYTLYLLASGAPDYTRFFTLGGASMPFALGATLYHWRDDINERFPMLNESLILPVVLFAIYLANITFSHVLGIHQVTGFYLNIALCTLMLASLNLRTRMPGVSRKADGLLGDLSYPIYLIHAPLSWLLLYLCQLADIPIRGPALTTFFAFLLPTIVVSWLMTVSIEKPIDLLRSRIKQGL